MASPTESPTDGVVNILCIGMLIFALIALALTFLAYQATAVS
jgi:hypothetical protein